jgi:hypothetical protein
MYMYGWFLIRSMLLLRWRSRAWLQRCQTSVIISNSLWSACSIYRQVSIDHGADMRLSLVICTVTVKSETAKTECENNTKKSLKYALITINSSDLTLGIHCNPSQTRDTAPLRNKVELRKITQDNFWIVYKYRRRGRSKKYKDRTAVAFQACRFLLIQLTKARDW